MKYIFEEDPARDCAGSFHFLYSWLKEAYSLQQLFSHSGHRYLQEKYLRMKGFVAQQMNVFYFLDIRGMMW